MPTDDHGLRAPSPPPERPLTLTRERALGLPAPLLWGAAMALVSIVPVLGAFVIWVPAAIFLALSGSVGKAIILTVWGLSVIATADNLLYPVLVGDRLKMHPLAVFISLVGGLAVFGFSGLVLGPVILALARRAGGPLAPAHRGGPAGGERLANRAGGGLRWSAGQSGDAFSSARNSSSKARSSATICGLLVSTVLVSFST